MSQQTITAAALRKPDTWDAVEALVKTRSYYDMDDSSHRLDVVQIVCEAVAALVASQPPLPEEQNA